MDARNSTNPSSPSPILRVLQLTHEGMVFESLQEFEVGSNVELGFHAKTLDLPDGAPGSAEASEFLLSEALVVSTLLCSADDGTPLFEVTVLFSSFDQSKRRALTRLADRGETEPPLDTSEEERALSNSYEKGYLGLN